MESCQWAGRNGMFGIGEKWKRGQGMEMEVVPGCERDEVRCSCSSCGEREGESRRRRQLRRMSTSTSHCVSRVELACSFLLLSTCLLNAGFVQAAFMGTNPLEDQLVRNVHTRRQLKQTVAPGAVNTITQACAATVYQSSCLATLNGDPRSYSASSRELVAITIGVAHQQAAGAATDSQTLVAQARGAGNANLTSVSNMCSEVTDLASFHIQNSQNTINGPLLNDVQAWLSGALTLMADCNAGLTQLTTSLPLVSQMTGRLSYGQQMISNALAMTDALVNYGPNTALWKPPPVTRQQMLNEAAISANPSSVPDWLSASDREILNGEYAAAPDVTVDLAAGAAFSIQRAVDLAPNWSSTRYVIYIRAGVYNEVVRIPKSKTNIMFQGDGADTTIITGSMSDSQYGMITWATATVGVSAAGFIARGVTFQNTAGPAGHQAVALRVNGDQSALLDCSIVGFQDSLYAHSFRQFYKNTYITGTVDFIFGNSAAVFQNCQLEVRVGAPGATTSTITAQGRIDSGQTTGLVFQDCSVTGTPDYVAQYQANPQAHQAFLGRPWKTFSRTVFIRTYIGQIIDPTGWLQWNGNFALSTLFDAEFGSYGPGAANINRRVTWSSQLTTPQAQAFSVSSFIQGPSWLPATGIPFSP